MTFFSRSFATAVACLWLVSPLVRAEHTESIQLTVGKSIVLDVPSPVARISTSNADVVDPSPVTSRQILVQGKSFGTATLVIWSKDGSRSFYTVTVEQNLDPLRRLLHDTFPGQDISVESSRDSVSLYGHVASKEIADHAAALAAGFGKTIVNNLQVAAPAEKQILLRVKFAELDRMASDQFAVNLTSTGSGNTVGGATTGQFASANPTQLRSAIGAPTSGTTSQFTISDALNIFAFRPDLNLAAFIKALQSQSLLQILAEPNLVTTNGKEASFVVGGEFPVPVMQGGTNGGSITILFREFGVRLNFTPVLTSNNTIRLHVRPEVSTLDFTNAVSFNGFTIPALSTRRMETDVELGIGQTFIIAGLLDNRVTESLSRVPGLASLPILGALFKSRDQKKSRTELVVMVTPDITRPVSVAAASAALPTFPHSFLVPVTPDAEPRKDAPAPNKNRKGKRK